MCVISLQSIQYLSLYGPWWGFLDYYADAFTWYFLGNASSWPVRWLRFQYFCLSVCFDQGLSSVPYINVPYTCRIFLHYRAFLDRSLSRSKATTKPLDVTNEGSNPGCSLFWYNVASKLLSTSLTGIQWIALETSRIHFTPLAVSMNMGKEKGTERLIWSLPQISVGTCLPVIEMQKNHDSQLEARCGRLGLYWPDWSVDSCLL